MKKAFLLLTTAFTLLAGAQKNFDSAAYAGFYQNRWEKIDFADLRKE